MGGKKLSLNIGYPLSQWYVERIYSIGAFKLKNFVENILVLSNQLACEFIRRVQRKGTRALIPILPLRVLSDGIFDHPQMTGSSKK